MSLRSASSQNGPVNVSGNGQLYPEALQRETDRGSQLREWVGLLWQGKWWILGVFVVVVGAVAAYTYSIPPKYRTSTLLLLDQGEQRSIVSSMSRGRGMGFRTQGSRLPGEIFRLRNSRVIAKRVARRLEEMRTHPRTGERLSVLYGAEGNRISTAGVAGRVQGMMSVRRAAGEEVGAFRITVTSTVPAEAALVSNLYAEEYVERVKERSRQSLEARRQFLEEQAARFRKRVQAAEDTLQAYMQRNGAVSLDQASSRVVQRIADLEARRDELRIELEMKRAALQKEQEQLEKIEPQLADRLSSGLSERLDRVQTEKAELEMRIEQIQRRNPELDPGDGTPQARELARTNQRIAELAQRADSLARRYVDQTFEAGGVNPSGGEGGRGLSYVAEQRDRLSQLRLEISSLEAQLGTVQERLTEQRAELQNIPAQSMRVAQMQRERRSAEQIFSFIREKLQETRIAAQSEVGYAEVVREAGVPYAPFAPNTRQNLILGALLGLALGGGLVVLWNTLDTRIYKPEDLRGQGHTVVGVVPSADDLIASNFDGAETLEIDGRSVQTSLVMLTSPMSAVAEAYRRIRTTLQFARPDDEVQTITVTSADKGEGKTTTATNLALALASGGTRTLLVDADLRRSRVHEVLDLERSPGLSELLYDEDLGLDTFETHVDHLSVLPSGDRVPNPAELLGSERMHRQMKAMRSAFDVVIFDTPPVLLFSDALALAPRCDGTFVVASAGQTDHRAFDHAADRLADVEADVLGAVLNRFDASATSHGYGYNYGYAYGYRQLDKYYEEERPTKQKGIWSG
jgi:capsular exopolysaccharide synthesis family protein